MRRVFAAVELNEKCLPRVSDHIRFLKERHPEARARWVSPEKMHLTLRFFAKAEDDQISEIISAIDESAAAMKEFEIRLAGTGVFPNKRSARVLWVGLEEDKALSRFKESIDQSLGRFGFEPESRKFRPHLTIARLKSNRDDRKLVEDHLQIKFEPVANPVNRVTLFESVLKQTGSEYSVLHVSQLGR